MLYLEDFNFNDLTNICDTIDFDEFITGPIPPKTERDTIWTELVEKNPECTYIELCPHDEVVSFECNGFRFRGQLWELLVEGNNFDEQMEVLEGFTKNEDGTWDLSGGVILLDNGNECFKKFIVSSPIQEDDNFILYYPHDGFDLVQGSVMFQTLDEQGEKEWSCFYELDGDPWFITIPNYDPSL